MGSPQMTPPPSHMAWAWHVLREGFRFCVSEGMSRQVGEGGSGRGGGKRSPGRKIGSGVAGRAVHRASEPRWAVLVGSRQGRAPVIAIAVPPPSLSRRPPGGYVASRTYEEAPLRPLGLRDTHTTTHTHMQVVRLSRRGGAGTGRARDRSAPDGGSPGSTCRIVFGYPTGRK